MRQCTYELIDGVFPVEQSCGGHAVDGIAHLRGRNRSRQIVIEHTDLAVVGIARSFALRTHYIEWAGHWKCRDWHPRRQRFDHDQSKRIGSAWKYENIC